MRLKYSTGIKINPKHWNSDKQRVRESRMLRESESMNMLLDEIEATAGNCYRTILIEGNTPTPALIRARLDELLKKGNAPSKDLAKFATKILEESNKKPGTKRTIKQSIRLLQEFRDETNRSIHFDSITLEFYDHFISHLIEKGYSQNSIGGHIKNVKAFMREAFERGLTKNVAFQSKRFRKIEEESQSIYLTIDELEKLANLDLTADPRLDRVRDLFLVGCYSGLRFSDLSQIKPENINKEKKYIRIKTQKTEEVVIIPLSLIIRGIVDKYENNLPRMSNEKMNEYLKELGQLAEINDPVLIEATKGGQQQTTVYQKWQLITTHTARRSFATNAYLSQVPTISIMKITGHKTEKSFLAYIKISQEDNANKLISHPFFS